MKRSHLKLAAILASCSLSAVARAQIPDNPTGGRPVANIPVNYVEANVGTFTLPDVLTTFDGQKVTDSKTWFEKRRPELRKWFEENVYGKVPATAPKVTWEVVSIDRNALDGKAIAKTLVGHMGGPDGPTIPVTVYTPASATGPVPILVSFSFGAIGGRGRGPATGPTAAGPATGPAIAPTARAGRGRGPGGPARGTPAELISRGYGYAALSKGSIESDVERAPVSPPNVDIARKLALSPGQTAPAPDEWGAIGAWAWGLSRLVDYFETDPNIDAKRVAITGGSRLGKTVTWAGANDPRIALVIACSGGEGGAAIARRNYGETIAHLVAPSRYPYQFAGNYQKYAADPNTMPVDTHALVALLAPRPILLSVALTDGWSDPYGEFVSAYNATPVYTLLGKQGLDNNEFPGHSKIVGHELSYFMLNGGHAQGDWDVWLKFMDTYLKPEKAN
jgi:hypothetical protein